MSLSDFPTAVGLIAAGSCPLCDEALSDAGYCQWCELGWHLGEIDGRAVVSFSRPLTDTERVKLYDRSSGKGEK